MKKKKKSRKEPKVTILNLKEFEAKENQEKRRKILFQCYDIIFKNKKDEGEKKEN